MTDLVTNLNTLTTKVAALRTKAKDKATELNSSVVIADTDTISDIVGKMQNKKIVLSGSTNKTMYIFNNYDIDTSNMTSLQYLFYYDGGTEIKPFDTSNVTNFNYSFAYSNLTEFSGFDTTKGTNFICMFWYCSKLTSVTDLDVSKSTNCQGLFSHCSNLTSVPVLDFSSCTNMQTVYDNCPKLTNVVLKNTSNATTFKWCFSGDYFLESIDGLDTSNATNLCGMFNRDLLYPNSGLKTIPYLDTAKATDMSTMFNKNNQLEKITQLDFKSLVSYTNIFYSCTKLTYINILNFGYSSKFIGTFDFSYCPWGSGSTENLQTVKDSLITNSFDRKTAGYSTMTIYLSTATKALLTDAEKAQITAKGYTIA